MKRGFLNSSQVKKQPLYAQSATKSPPDYLKEIGDVPKPAYGKVEDTGLPDDYDATSKPETTLFDASRIHYDEGMMALTTIPPQCLDGPADADGHCEWIVWGPTKAKVANLPGYPCPIPKPRQSKMYVVRSTQDKGLGVFATRDIKIGELIFSERPLLVRPSGVRAFSHVPEHYSQEKRMQIAMFEQEKYLQVAVDRMDEHKREVFMALANSHKEDGSGPIFGIIRTNAFGIENLGDGPKPPAGKSYPLHLRYGAICELGSRINHSCMPNVRTSFKLSSFSMQFSATKDIKAGDELLYSYCPMLQTVADRQKDLAPYGFECKCTACLHATPATDKLRVEFYDRSLRLLQERPNKWTQSPLLGVSILGPLFELRKDAIQEGLDSDPMYPVIVQAIEAAYMALGFDEQAKPYSEIRCRWDNMAKDED